MITHYLRVMDEPEERVDEVADAALVALAHMVDDVATVEDLHAYRAWVARLRLTGSSEDSLFASITVMKDLSKKLGVE